ncbi:hypothetical protein [Pedobacter agri]|uniref:Uncharacterized protein n=1 Tax=Pedobacter agri TaxID=454586 RepID=A0A9X3DE35_9SPHI|nr:hypothetical protein [Pedobacter agri]MCX3265490.1 hypothetical protein [Pedobacter agri]
MKTAISLTLILSLWCLAGIAQQLPAHIQKLNRKTDLTTVKFERMLMLSGGRKVYEFSITSKSQCIHCERGTTFYDENGNTVAYFTTSRGPSAFVADGYTLAEFGKSGAQGVKYGAKRENLPAPIARVIAKSDSLNKAGVKQIVQVKLRDQILYSFEHKLNPKLPNCKDCPVVIVFYNANYQPEVTFHVGGFAGITATNGYKSTDYTSRQKLWILWNAN